MKISNDHNLGQQKLNELAKPDELLSVNVYRIAFPSCVIVCFDNWYVL